VDIQQKDSPCSFPAQSPPFWLLSPGWLFAVPICCHIICLRKNYSIAKQVPLPEKRLAGRSSV
jgi:hypothetical protein